MVVKRDNMSNILVTASHGCSQKPQYNWLCDENSTEIGTEITKQLKKNGYNVNFIHTDAFRGFIDANKKEANLKHLPSGSELKRRLNDTNEKIKQMKEMGVLPNDTELLTSFDVLKEIAKAIQFREDIKQHISNVNVHFDIHSFGGCQAGVKSFDCKDIAVLDIVFYGKDNKMTKKLTRELEETPFSVDKFRGSRANKVVVGSHVKNSALIEFNQDMIDKRANKAFKKRKKEIEKNWDEFTKDEQKKIETQTLDQTIQEITNQILPAFYRTIRELK